MAENENKNDIQMQDEMMDTVETGKTEKTGFDFGRNLFDWAESLTKALVFVVLIFVFIARFIGVSGTSMIPTLHDKDFLIVSDLGYKPEVGDIVVMTKKGFLVNEKGYEDSFVKRVVATEGQKVYIDYDEGAVYVDGERQDDSFTNTPTTRRGDYTFPEGGLTVPEGHIFALGDNRNGSQDSRYSWVGMIDERYIVGKVLFRFLPLKVFGVVK